MTYDSQLEEQLEEVKQRYMTATLRLESLNNYEPTLSLLLSARVHAKDAAEALSASIIYLRNAWVAAQDNDTAGLQHYLNLLRGWLQRAETSMAAQETADNHTKGFEAWLDRVP